MDSSPSIDGGILAGGRSSRFKGHNKALAKLDGVPLVTSLVNIIQPYVENTYISCNLQTEAFENLNLPIIKDENPDLLGPLAGILAIMKRSKAEFLITTPCDTPLIPQNYVEILKTALYKELEKNTKTPIIAVSVGNRKHPLHLCIHHSYQSKLQDYLNQGGRKVMSWIEEQNPFWLTLPPEEYDFTNINTPDILASLNS